jgi:hypothetical protein
MLIFEPDEGTQPVAGIVMVHGGVLHSGSADGLAPHCRELASRGIFAGSAGYRIGGIDRPGPGRPSADPPRARRPGGPGHRGGVELEQIVGGTPPPGSS